MGDQGWGIGCLGCDNVSVVPEAMGLSSEFPGHSQFKYLIARNPIDGISSSAERRKRTHYASMHVLLTQTGSYAGDKN
jgi:hypothetical protein